MKSLFLFLTLVFIVSNANCQKADSLLNVFENKKLADSVRLKAIGDYSWELINSYPDSAIIFANKELVFANQTKLVSWQIDAYNTIGYSNFRLGKFKEAIKFYSLCKNLAIKSKSKRGLGAAMNNLGIVSYQKGDYIRAIQYYLAGLKVFEEVKDFSAVANSLNNIGSIYRELLDFDKASAYYQKALKLFYKKHDDRGVSMVMNNLGMIQNNLHQYLKAIPFFRKSIALKIKLNDKFGLVNSYLNIGGTYANARMNDSAKHYYDICLGLVKELNDEVGLASLSSNYGELENRLGNSRKAIEWCLHGYELAVKNEALSEVKVNCKCLTEAYEKTGNFKKTYYYHLRYIASRDSLYSKERLKEITRKEMQFAFDKKATADSVRNAEREKVHNAELKLRNAQIKSDQVLKYSLYIGLFLILIFLIFIYNRFKLSKRQNKIIVAQKEMVEERNKEITDSINYAKRIQQALLPSEKYMDKNLKKK